MKNKISRKQILILLLWLLLWQGLSLLVHNPILLVGPFQTALRLVRLLFTGRFYLALLSSWTRILWGLFVGSAAAVLAAYAAFLWRSLKDFLAPFAATLRAIPVASFVILLLIWVGGTRISSFISAIIVFPILYQGTLTGLSSVTKEMREMASVFHLPFASRLRCVELPAALPSVFSALTLGIGMAFKSGVAAEVIAQAGATLGNELYRSKIYLETGDLLAYTAVIILVAWISEKGILGLLHVLEGRLLYARPTEMAAAESAGAPSADLSASFTESPSSDIASEPLLTFSHISKTYDQTDVLSDVNLTIHRGETVLLTGASGSGKTTLLRLLLALEKPTAGQIETARDLEHGPLSLCAGTVFQENRLCEGFSGFEQIRMLSPKRQRARMPEIAADLNYLLETDAACQAVSTYSGGMKRRCAIARAVAMDAPLLVMDEPFSGLDEENRRRALEYILAHRGGRALILAVHDGNEVPGLKQFTRYHVEGGQVRPM